jgi:hypothetical protein
MQDENLAPFVCPLRGEKLSQRENCHQIAGGTPETTRGTRVLLHFVVTGVSVTGPSRPQSVSGQWEASNGL